MHVQEPPSKTVHCCSISRIFKIGRKAFSLSMDIMYSCSITVVYCINVPPLPCIRKTSVLIFNAYISSTGGFFFKEFGVFNHPFYHKPFFITKHTSQIQDFCSFQNMFLKTLFSKIYQLLPNTFSSQHFLGNVSCAHPQ